MLMDGNESFGCTQWYYLKQWWKHSCLRDTLHCVPTACVEEDKGFLLIIRAFVRRYLCAQHNIWVIWFNYYYFFTVNAFIFTPVPTSTPNLHITCYSANIDTWDCTIYMSIVIYCSREINPISLNFQISNSKRLIKFLDR